MVRAASVGAVVAGLRASEIARLARDRSPLVRAAVAAGIGTPGIPQATQVLLALAKDETAAVRAAAVRSLGALGAQAPIFDARSDRDPSVRAEVAGALRPTEPRALDLLISLSHDRHRAVAQAAARNLWRNCFSLPERAASQAVELLHQEATAPAAAQGLAAAVDANPRLIGEACRLLAAGEVEPAVLWIIARAAETAEVADLARSAARSLETGEDLGAGLGDLSLALRWAGFEHVADICEWLAECAEADSQEDIGRLTAGAPRTDFEPVACLAAAARAVKKAGGARSLDSRARHLAQARATLDICTERTRDAGYRPVVDAIVKTWSVALAPLPATISTKPPEPMRLQVPTPKAEVKSRKAGGRLSAAVTNPYVVGKPLIADSPMFFGREDDLAFVERGLQSGESGAVLVLVGQRRTGKTSLLRQLEARLRRSYWCSPAFIDVQGMLVGDTDALFRQLARSALSAAEQPGLDIKGSGAEMVWDVAERLERRLVLLIDEFDDLEQKVRTGVLPPEVFSQLRSMIQHGASISLVLCGTHRVESLAGEHWSFLLNMATHRRIGALAPQAAADVIRVPLARLGIACDEAALVAAAGLAGCHPYFLQLLGYRLIENCVESGLAAVGTDDMGKAADQVIEQGAVHLRYLWDICGPKGQPIVRALTTERGSLSFEQLRSATGLGATHLRRVVRELAEAEVVQEQAGRYSVQIGLLSHWIATALPHKWL
jgi:HEAT repeat protein